MEKEKRKAASKKTVKKAANSAEPSKSESVRISRPCNLLNSVAAGGVPRIDGAADESDAEAKPENPRTEGTEEIAEVGVIASGWDRGIKPKRKR